MTALWLVAALLLGAAAGYLAAVSRTPKLIARMSRAELAHLTARVNAARRRKAGDA